MKNGILISIESKEEFHRLREGLAKKINQEDQNLVFFDNIDSLDIANHDSKVRLLESFAYMRTILLNQIKPSLEKGDTVIVSNYCSQIIAESINGVGLKSCLNLATFSLDGIIPDLTYILKSENHRNKKEEQIFQELKNISKTNIFGNANILKEDNLNLEQKISEDINTLILAMNLKNKYGGKPY